MLNVLLGQKNTLTHVYYQYMMMNYYSEGYHQNEEVFNALTEDNILQPYISDEDFRSSNVRADAVGYNLYVFDIRYQKNFTNSQFIRVEFKFDGVVLNDINGYALVITTKLVSIGSDGQRPFDPI